MKNIIYTTLFCLLATHGYAQEAVNQIVSVNPKYLVRSALGSNGLSKTITSGNTKYYVSQSIGQGSVIGTFSKNNHTIRQGFQQPLMRLQKINIKEEGILEGNVFPNPFNEQITVVFDEEITNQMSVVIYGLSGSVLSSKIYPAAPKITISTDFLANGEYILKIVTENKQLLAKIIKQ